MDKKEFYFIAIGILLAFLAGTTIGSVTFLGELNSLKTQLSALQNQVAELSSENTEIKLSLSNLNKTLQSLVEVLHNKTAVIPIEGLLLKMEVKSVVRRGETVQINFSLTNFNTQPVTLTFPSSKVFDFKVVDSSGKVVYRWSQDKVFLTVITKITLKPGESKNETLTWRCELPEGEYTIIGIVEAYNATLISSKPLKVVP